MRVTVDQLVRRIRLDLSTELAQVERQRLWRATLGRLAFLADGQITRSDAGGVALFRIPGGAELHALWLWSPAGSDAGATAEIDVGTTANPTLLLSGFDVRGAAGAGQIVPRALRRHGPLGSEPVEARGRYAETGAASTTGGPWTVTALYSRRD